MEILLVEDNLVIVKGLKYSFEKNGFSFVHKASFRESKDYIEHEPNHIDLAILDISLPDGDGFCLYEKVIKDRGIPVIFLTAKDDENDIVKGLEIGAEDYITKPFSTKELMARVNKILSRNKKNNKITVSNICFDMDKMIVYKDEEKVDLTSLEIKLLQLLFMNLNKVVTRAVILDKIWEWTGNDVDDHTVTVYFKRIREKIGENIIVTVKGIGYRIDEEKD